MAFRSLAASAFLLFSLVLQANYLVVLENGDTLSSKKGFKKGDALDLTTGPVPVRDVVFVEHNTERWTYRLSDEQKMPLPFCRDTISAFACAYAVKHGPDKMLGEFPMVDPNWASDPRFIACWRTALLDQWVRTDVQGRPLPHDTVRPFKSEELSVILRNGDTLMVGKNNFFMKGDTLCWFGGGRLHKDQVLLLRSKKGLQIIQDRNDHIAKFEQPIPDLSPASRGVIYGHIYGGTTLSDLPTSDLPDAPAILAASATEAAFVAARMQNRSSTLSGVNVGMSLAKNLFLFVP